MRDGQNSLLYSSSTGTCLRDRCSSNLFAKTGCHSANLEIENLALNTDVVCKPHTLPGCQKVGLLKAFPTRVALWSRRMEEESMNLVLKALLSSVFV